MIYTDLPGRSRQTARYSQRPLPAYRYVPGVNPHPLRDPRGHSYEPQPKLAGHPPWNPGDWAALDEWRYGIDLFNRFYFWEAHEAWEALWASTPRDEAPSLLLQGLIQIAAALLKTHMQVIAGAQPLSTAGLDKLRRASAQHRTLMGLDLPSTASAFSTYFTPLESGRLPNIDDAVPVLRLAP